MRLIISILVLTLSLQLWTKADDISEFEIEGISIGDSLLEHDKTIGLTVEDLKSFVHLRARA